MAKTKYLSTEKTDINAAYIVERHQKKKKKASFTEKQWESEES